jgi:predicted Zn-dependent protease
MAVNGVTNSEGGSAGRAFSMSAYANTAGFNGAGWIGWHSVSVSAIAGKDTGMETDYDYEARTYLSDMPSPESVGKKAGERAVKRLNPRKLDSGAMPIVFDPRVSSGLIGHFLGAINGAGVARGTSSPPSPSPTNVHLEPGKQTPTELMADIKEGLYVTHLIGMGVNGVTGDYSRGAAGFVIRNGELAEPVAEITIAGNLKQMFANLAPANDLTIRFGTDAPTVRVDGMTVAGR